MILKHNNLLIKWNMNTEVFADFTMVITVFFHCPAKIVFFHGKTQQWCQSTKFWWNQGMHAELLTIQHSSNFPGWISSSGSWVERRNTSNYDIFWKNIGQLPVTVVPQSRPNFGFYNPIKFIGWMDTTAHILSVGNFNLFGVYNSMI